jgi:IstB-like ATP binding protein
MRIGYTEFSLGYEFTENLIRSSASGPKNHQLGPANEDGRNGRIGGVGTAPCTRGQRQHMRDVTLAIRRREGHGDAAERRRDLLEIMEDRHARGSTIVTSQPPVEHWHDSIGDSTIADAILDRLVHNAHRLTLKGESLRKAAAKRHNLDAGPAA